MATGAGEYSREMLRKPFVIGRWMYSNGVRVPNVSQDQRTWLSGRIELGVERVGIRATRRGEAIFRGECGSCHTLQGYRPLAILLQGRDRANIHNFIVMLHENKADSPYRKFMPPMVGTEQDVSDLTDFLNEHVNLPVSASQKPMLTAKK